MSEKAKHERDEPDLRFPEFEGEWERGNPKILNINIIDGDRGNNYPSSTDFLSSGYCLFLNAKNVTKSGFNFQEVSFISKQKDASMKKGKVQRNDLILTTRGTLGQIAIYDVSVPYNNIRINSGMVLLRSNSNIYPFFLYQQIKSTRFQRDVTRISFGSAQPQLTVSTISKIILFAPPLPEQEKIASFLSAVDEKITQLEEKKKLLEDYKKGCMQQLFSQALRFKDEDGNDFPDWEETTIGKIGYFYYGKSAPKFSLAPDAPTACVRYGELYSKYGLIIEDVKSRTTIDPKNLRFSKGGEILVPRVGENPLDFATCCLLVPSKIAIGEMISVYNTEENSLFYTYYFRTYRKQFAKMVEGGNVSNLYYSYLEDIPIGRPHPDEQQKIADFLSVLDDKITHATEQLEQIKSFKKGLLQKMFV